MSSTAPTARAEFAQRLRRLRAARGYQRARHLAEALGIDENRYTRYERAETEPDISLLTVICRKLALTPNELLGFEPRPPLTFPEGTGLGAEAPGLHEPGADETGMSSPAAPLVGQDSAALWQLAELAVRHLDSFGVPAGASELSRIAQVASVFATLKSDPLAGVGRIASETARAGLAVEAQAAVETALERLLARLTQGRAAG